MFGNLFCKHQWKTLKEYHLEDATNCVVALGFLQECTKCGKLDYRVFRLNGSPF